MKLNTNGVRTFSPPTLNIRDALKCITIVLKNIYVNIYIVDICIFPIMRLGILMAYLSNFIERLTPTFVPFIHSNQFLQAKLVLFALNKSSLTDFICNIDIWKALVMG